jgi:hypothetical protein
MKCPNCGYFNLPGASACGQCRRSLEEGSTPAAAAVPIAEIYPPRASKRSAAAQIDAHSPTARRAKRLARADWERTKTDVAERRLSFQLGWQNFKASVLWWFDSDNLRQAVQWNLPPVLSIIPGFGQCLQRRFLMAGVLLALFVPLAIGATLIITRDWSVRINGLVAFAAPLIALPYVLILNGVLLAFCALVWFSVWDAALHSYPPAPRGDFLANRFRWLRLAFGSAIYAAFMLAAFFGFLNLWRW